MSRADDAAPGYGPLKSDKPGVKRDLAIKAGFGPDAASVQEQPPNFREDGVLYLVRCFVCGGKHGRENYALAVASSSCAWCGWRDPNLIGDDRG